jgi:ABC-2 type transport system ATP-binding protein
MTSSDVVLDIQGLAKRYRRIHAVDDLTLQIRQGEFVGLIGPNGAGKSTTMNCVTGLTLPDSGAIEIAGHPFFTDALNARKAIGYVAQDPFLPRHLTGREYLEFVGSLRDLNGDALEHEVRELLELAELTDAENRLIKEYSGGMARKLAITAALIGSPALLLLDESFVGLDPESTWRIRGRLETFRADGGAIVLSSHILDMVQEICSRVVMLHHGKVAVDREMSKLRDDFDEECPNLTMLYLQKAGKTEVGLKLKPSPSGAGVI